MPVKNALIGAHSSFSNTPRTARTCASPPARHGGRRSFHAGRLALAAALACTALAGTPSRAQIAYSGGAPVWLADGTEFLTRDAWLAFCAGNPTANCVERHFWGLGGTWAGAVPGAGDDVLVGAGQTVRVQAFDSRLRGPVAGQAFARDVQVLGRIELFDRLRVASGSFAELALGVGGVLESSGLAQVTRLTVDSGVRAAFEGDGGTTRLQSWDGPALIAEVGWGHRLELTGDASGQGTLDAQVGQGAVLALTGRWSGDRWGANAPAGTVQPFTGRVSNSGTLVARQIDFGALAFDNTGTTRVTVGGTLVQRGGALGGRYEGEAGSSMSFEDALSMAAGSSIDTLGSVRLRLDRALVTSALAGDLRAAQVELQGRHALSGALVAGQVTVTSSPTSNGSRLSLVGPGVDVQRITLGDGLGQSTLEVTGAGGRLGDVSLNTARVSLLGGAQATIGSLTHAGGSFNVVEVGSGAELVVAGTFQWGAQSGALSGFGTLRLQGASALDARADNVVVAGPLRIVNEGTMALQGDLRAGGSAIDGFYSVRNGAGARLEISNGSLLSNSRHINHGTWVQTAATGGGRTVFGPLDNHGLLRVEGGSLDLREGGVHTGRFEAADGAWIRLAGDNRFDAGIQTLGRVDVSARSIQIGSAGSYTVRNGTGFQALTLDIAAGGRFDAETRLAGSSLAVVDRLDNAGTLRLVDAALDAGSAAVFNSGRLEFGGGERSAVQAGSLHNTGHLDLAAFNSRIAVTGSFQHAGTAYSEAWLTLRGTSVFEPGSQFENQGRIIVEGGDLNLLGSVTGAGWLVQTSGRTTLGAAGAPGNLSLGLLGIDAGVLETEGTINGHLVTIGGVGQWAASGPTQLIGARVTTQGEVTVPAGSELVVGGSEFRQTGGRTVVEGRLAAPALFIDGGVLRGSGTIDGDVFVGAGGTWEPGSSPGTVTVNGNVAINGGTLRLEFGADGRNDRIVASGSLSVSGTLDIDIGGNAVLFGDSLSWAEAASQDINATVVVPGLAPDLVGQLSGNGGTVLFTDPGATPLAPGGSVFVPAGSSQFVDGASNLSSLAVEGRVANPASGVLDLGDLTVGASGSLLNRGIASAVSVFNDGQFVSRPGSRWNLGQVTHRGRWINEGTVEVSGGLIAESAFLDNAVGAQLQAQEFSFVGGVFDNRGIARFEQARLAGESVRIAAGGELVATMLTVAGPVNNLGRLQAQRLVVDLGGALVNNGVLEIGVDGAEVNGELRLDAGDLLGQGRLQQNGRLHVATGRTLRLVGAPFGQGAGTTTLEGRIEASEVLLEGGTLEGNGQIAADVVLSGGAEISPGPGLATLGIDGNLNARGGRFTIGLGHGGALDRLEVGGDAVFDFGVGNAIVFQLNGGYVPADGDSFNWLLAGGMLSGVVDSSWRVEAPDGLGGFLLWGDAGGIYQPAPTGLRIVFEGSEIYFTTTPVPEPATLLLMLAGVGTLLWRRRGR
ncbi:MAG: PEP-CTERM sorting domain-containing protein [Rubrivivax sp.]|nr:PEP-CTERM sorting domain-containing protein [Rubrivivax sp.]